MYKRIVSVVSTEFAMIKDYMDYIKKKKHGGNSNETDGLYIEELHKFLFLHDLDDVSFEYKRIGSKRDGGYVMVCPMSTNKIAYSIGIFDNVDWDNEMVNNGYDVFMYDHTIECLPFSKEGFHWFKQGICGGELRVDLRPITRMLLDNGHTSETGMVLKMDVEGYEWEVLDDISVKTLIQFDQIIMEMHGLVTGSNREQMVRCLKKLSSTHDLVHIHANNTGKIIRQYVMTSIL